jgi:hypothetical protein
VVTRIKATTFAMTTFHGRRRGYIESAIKCPKSAKLPFHADFKFAQNGDPSLPGSASADSKITCQR